MKPHLTFITLRVDGLGLPTKGIVGTEFEHGAVAFFDLQAGLKLSLWPRKSLAADAGPRVQPSSTTDFSLAHNVGSRLEIDDLMRQAERAGATMVKPAQPTCWRRRTEPSRECTQP